MERAAGVAHYRLHTLIEQHSNDAVTSFSEAKMKRDD